MCATPSRPPRVLLGDLAPMHRLGMRRLLAERGVEVTEQSGSAELVQAAAEVEPDAIVLPLDERAFDDVARAQAAAPGAKLILWARDESEMHVYDAGRTVPRRVSAGTAGALLSELETGERRREGD
ncbi:MAG: hypothetical protein AB7V62_00390 [Thermoleophilia bacterium]